ncbi:hypothetical protein [Deinococcus aluminii]|uniref:Uncharacterized protein n=1 Tax=Deinococcus aluminii TaxID=1656885 RepID=A0ABP9XHH5_9DEIO
MIDLSDLLVNLLFLIGSVFLGVYVLLWLLSPRLRREIEAPKYRLQAQLDAERGRAAPEPGPEERP